MIIQQRTNRIGRREEKITESEIAGYILVGIICIVAGFEYLREQCFNNIER